MSGFEEKITFITKRCDRIESDAESEKDTRRRRNERFDDQIRDLSLKVEAIIKESNDHQREHGEIMETLENINRTLETMMTWLQNHDGQGDNTTHKAIHMRFSTVFRKFGILDGVGWAIATLGVGAAVLNWLMSHK